MIGTVKKLDKGGEIRMAELHGVTFSFCGCRRLPKQFLTLLTCDRVRSSVLRR
jgi:hypothetical protein